MTASALPLWSLDQLDELAPEADGEVGSLLRRYVVPPFTVLDTRQGYWQDRKREWLGLGITSELGRGDNLSETGAGGINATGRAKTYNTQQWVADKNIRGNSQGQTGTSVFDPVLCEVAYRWYCPQGGHVLDPFAGGSVRGVVAAVLGLNYSGIDLSLPQIEANRQQGQVLCPPEQMPQWIHGDSRAVVQRALPGAAVDFIFSCPPYADLEVYSDDPRDLSTMPYEQFLRAYADIIGGAVAMLRPGRFAAWVVGDIRDRKGHLRDFPGATIRAFADAGAVLFNDHVLLTAIGSLPVRVSGQFAAGRKAGRAHQLMQVYVKGDPKDAVTACGHVGEEVLWSPRQAIRPR